MADSALGLWWPRRLTKPKAPVVAPPEPGVPPEADALMNEAADLAAPRSGTAPMPPGVLGYAVGVFPGGGNTCSGLTHTGLMSLESARREAGQYAATARSEPAHDVHAACAYAAVEVRAVSRG